jgi:uncharacterized membrane protein
MMVIAETAGMIGIVTSAILASAGYLYKIRGDQKRNARRVLYFLLEIRFHVYAAMFDIEGAINPDNARTRVR